MEVYSQLALKKSHNNFHAVKLSFQATIGWLEHVTPEERYAILRRTIRKSPRHLRQFGQIPPKVLRTPRLLYLMDGRQVVATPATR